MTQSGSTSSIVTAPHLPSSWQSGTARGLACRVPYQTRTFDSFDWERFCTVGSLLASSDEARRFGGDSPGPDGIRFGRLSATEHFELLRSLSASLANSTYAPAAPRAHDTPKADGGVRTIYIQDYIDRIVSKHIDLCLKPRWRTVFTFPSALGVLARLDRLVRATGWHWLAINDIRRCFDNAPREIIMALHRRYIGDNRLLRLIELHLYLHASLRQGIGVPQGSAYVATAMELLLYYCFDLAIAARLGQRNTSHLRYADNFAFLCGSVSEGVDILSSADEVLGSAGFVRKYPEEPPTDLRIPDRNRTFLGFVLGWEGEQITFSIPELAYEDLAEGLLLAQDASDPVENAKERCVGWMNAMGPALTRTVVPETVSRATEVARRHGFREVSERRLTSVAHEARRRWERKLAETQA